MITIDALRDYGADVDEGLARCLNKEDFYLKMLNMAIPDERFLSLKGIIEQQNLDAAFETAHALKGVLGNLALTPLFKPISELTELLRARTQTDYAPLCAEIQAQYERLLALTA